MTLNTDEGIRIRWESSNNTITGNKLADNTYAMFTQLYSSGNVIYYNNFINNAEHASSSWSNSTWDNGYPSGGNYWSDYAGNDLNGDGIGNDPYIIDPNNQDCYPLMAPEGGEELTNIAIINVTAYYDNDPIETQTINNLAPSTNMTVTIYWNTANVTPQNYTIKAEATPVPGETA